jgi:hypothetical protein
MILRRVEPLKRNTSKPQTDDRPARRPVYSTKVVGNLTYRKRSPDQAIMFRAEEEASMLRRAIGHNSRSLPQRRHPGEGIRWTEIDSGVHTREGEHPLEAMMHWHDLAERFRAIRCRRKSLLDDNPSSG